MSELRGACIIGQSGGPTAVINASALGVIRTALDTDCITRVLGAANGIQGVLEDRLYDMGQEDAGELELLRYTPSSALGSCRYKLADPSQDDTDYRRILEIFRKYDVRYFFYNGGNDSMDTCNKISKYMQSVGYACRVIGVPKTIDNDLNAPTTARASAPQPDTSLPPAWRSNGTPMCTTTEPLPFWRSWDATPAGWPARLLWLPGRATARISSTFPRWILTWNAFWRMSTRSIRRRTSA